MSNSELKPKAAYSVLEERWNYGTHGIGAVLSAIGLCFLVQRGISLADNWVLIGMTVFGISMILMFTASTIYHWVSRVELKKQLRLLDHTAIYLLIAGSYTPFALGNLRNGYGIGIFILMWSLVLLGIAFKFSLRKKINSFRKLDVLLYTSMGCVALLFIKPIINSMPINGFYWLLGGGLFYISGTFFYLKKSIPFNHAIWHGFVMGGTFCHFLAVLCYVNSPIV
ncbi:UNVERIFIED_CONTAM: hypothetical protein GTU68_038826 [Idotea baltica]|nr:hypothetical protein [Idotea baltica]